MTVKKRRPFIEQLKATLKGGSGQPVHARGVLGVREASALLSLADVDRFLESRPLRYPDVRLVRAGEVIDVCLYTAASGRSASPSGVERHLIPQLDRVRDEFNRGATILLQGLHRSWPPLRALCGELQADLELPVQADAVVTPARAQGLDIHIDAYDSIIVQTFGAKDWQLFEGKVPLPMEGRTKREGNRSHGPLLKRVRLRPGDWLYLPRGLPHAATTGATSSVHATLSILGRAWIELLSELTRGANAAAPPVPNSLSVDPLTDQGRLSQTVRCHLDTLANWLVRLSNERRPLGQ